MFKFNVKFDEDQLLYSLSTLNVMATQYTCSFNGSAAPTDQYSEVIIDHACTLQSILLGCHVTSMSGKLLLLYQQHLDFFWTDLVYLYINKCTYTTQMYTHTHTHTYSNPYTVKVWENCRKALQGSSDYTETIALCMLYSSAI